MGIAGEIVKDVTFALRSYARTPAFTIVALLTLALGVGANAAIFSVLRGAYLTPLEFEEPGELFFMGQSTLDGPVQYMTFPAGSFMD